MVSYTTFNFLEVKTSFWCSQMQTHQKRKTVRSPNFVRRAVQISCPLKIALVDSHKQLDITLTVSGDTMNCFLNMHIKRKKVINQIIPYAFPQPSFCSLTRSLSYK